MPNLPEIRIKDGWLLRENASKHLHELWGEGQPLADDAWMEVRVGEYKQAWKPHEEKIVSAMCNLLGLKFKQSVIDVYIAPWFKAISDPIIIGVMSKPDEFIDFLTHELLHRLLTDNTSLDPEVDLVSRWKVLFGKQHTFTTLVHIPVHAVQKAIYLDILKDTVRLERDMKINLDANALDYTASWEYVNNHDYHDLIAKLRKDYR